MTPCEWHPAIRLAFDAIVMIVVIDYLRIKWRRQ